MYTLFWGSRWKGNPLAGYLNRFFPALFAGGRFMANLAQYSAGAYRIGNGTFAGQFALVEFASDSNQVVARGFVSGVLTDSHGKVVASIMRDVAIPVTASNAAASSNRLSSLSIGVSAVGNCPILHLDLGPLHLDVLGLRVDLSEVILDISAQSGPGNLLGNLLCAVANLLNGGGSVTTLANLLNQILQAIVNLLG